MIGEATKRLLKKLDDVLIALLMVALVDVVLFHLGAYVPLLQPDSYSGGVERRARRFADLVQAFPDRNRILVMGNSQTVASIQEGRLEAELAEGGLACQVANLAMGGSSPRAWYVLLKGGWVPRHDTEIVILGIGSDALRAHPRDELLDVEIAKTRLKILDAFALAGAYPKIEDRLAVFSGVIFRTPLFRDDVKQFLQAPGARHRQVVEARAQFESRRQAGTRVDNQSHRNLLSARLGEDNQLVLDDLDDFLMADKDLRHWVERLLRRQKRRARAMSRGKMRVRSFAVDPGKTRLLGRLVEGLNEEGIKVVLSVIPETPYSLGGPRVDPFIDLFRDLTERGADVELWLEPELLRQINAPAYFQDPLHVNADGAKLYTRGLARGLTAILTGTQN